MKKRLAALCLLILLPAYAASAAQPPQLSMSFAEGSITITGVSKGQPVYLFGIAREPLGYITRVQPHETQLVDATGSGSVSYKFDEKLWLRSVWVAVDMVSGAAAAGAPPRYNAITFPLTEKHLKKNASGQIAQLSAAGTTLEFVVIRPGAGVWGDTVMSRGKNDEGTENGNATISVAKLNGRGDTKQPAPDKLKKGDIVFILDSFHKQYGVATIGD